MPPLALYITLILAGLILLASEIFVPGGVVGTLGGLLLIAAAIVGFDLFGPEGGVLSLIGLLVLLGAYIVLLVHYLPRSFIGRKFTLKEDLKDSHSSARSYMDILGQEGVAITDLRPAGIARVGEERVHVMAESNWIEKETPIRVVAAEGNRVMVRKLSAS